jgi:hypothetical protein
MIIQHIPSEIYMALGIVCYTRFNPENSVDIYYHCKAKKCVGCKTPLVFKETKYTKNTDKTCDGKCYECIEKRQKEIKAEMQKRYEVEQQARLKQYEEPKSLKVYLNVRYDDKDDAKSMGAWWDPEQKKWYAPNNTLKYKSLIEKYS